jgi:hypothetical protein
LHEYKKIEFEEILGLLQPLVILEFIEQLKLKLKLIAHA